ncbi:hypothetical protein C1H46_009251 [Malus baccata]|uniref:Kinesin-like protein n=1 Tax=Malus baccata TaxID=106549 RepID=A0A540N253_MALBA|nr:hypothetical protein C1H46_009251 [Malus baccata]
MFPQICKDVVPDHDSKSSSTSGAVKTLETTTTQLDSDVSNRECTPDIATEPVDGDLIGESSTSKGTEEGSPGQMVLPVLQKITDLTTKIQDLKREHTALSVEVKLTTNSFPDPAVLNTIQLLSIEHELLKKKYLDESSERKRLYNEMIELKGNIRVFCRCRPLNQIEISSGSGSVVEFESSLDNELQVICSDSSKKQFKFDHVFRPEDNQEAVFAQTKPIVTSVLDGYNVCIFAYGQTGTGKTFTMEGTPENRGVNYRTLEELFRISKDRGGFMRYELCVSMLEVYNEKIRDLLVDNTNQPTKKLEIKQCADGTLDVPGLVQERVYGFEEMWELLKSGSQARSVGSTSANEQSSRSHCLLRVTVKGENLINGQKTRSQLWLVDLAGSERVGRIDVEGGDCKTLMFVQISPSASDLGETLCSLNFASRVRGIESGPARKQADLSELFKYKQMAEKAKHDEKETKKLQDCIQSLQLRLAAREHICRSLQEKNRDLENQLAEERKTRLKQETRAFAAASHQSSASSFRKQGAQKTVAEKKPPLAPPRARLPLRRISNFMPPPSSALPPKKTSSTTSVPSLVGGKENISTTALAGRNQKSLILPRRISIAVRPPTATTQQVLQPKRRVSIATYRPEPSSHMTTPLHTSASLSNSDRPSFARDPRRARYSRLFSPMPELKSEAETTPTTMRRSSKFMGSPPTLAGSVRAARHPAAVALLRKPVVWSPLKLRAMKNRRPSLLLPPPGFK